jgi:hypothetical protein
MRSQAIDGLRKIANSGLQPELIHFAQDVLEPGIGLDAVSTALDLFPKSRMLGSMAADPGLRRSLEALIDGSKRKLETRGSSWRVGPSNS